MNENTMFFQDINRLHLGNLKSNLEMRYGTGKILK